MSGEEEENAAELKIGDEFLKAKCLMNCEVSLILEHKFEQLQQMSDDPRNQISQVFEKSLQYVKRFSRYKNPDAVKQVREYPSNCKRWKFYLLCCSFMVMLQLCYIYTCAPVESQPILDIALMSFHSFLGVSDRDSNLHNFLINPINPN
ncbi:unnamed protein product [Malus baccata var. baccata]